MVKITLRIEGMACGMCESHINDTVRRQFAVKKVSSSHSRGLTEIIGEEPLDQGALIRAINETGYRVLSVKTEPYEKKGFSLFHRKGRYPCGCRPVHRCEASLQALPAREKKG